MAKLTFNYGCMGSGKTTSLLTSFDSCKRKNKNPIIVKPCLDTREGKFTGWGVTKSRITKNEESAYYFQNIEEIIKLDFGIVFVDECQFLTKKDVLFLCYIVDYKNIDVICYGLKCDVNAELFEGSKHIIALADEVKEIDTMCDIEGCCNKAVAHLRYIDGERDLSKKSIAIESDNITYKSVCRKHWLNEEN